jgi:hypothetical protein
MRKFLQVFTLALCLAGFQPDAAALSLPSGFVGSIASGTSVSDCDDIAACVLSMTFIDLSDAILISDAPLKAGELAQSNVIFGETNETPAALLFLAGLLVFCAARWGESVVRTSEPA